MGFAEMPMAISAPGLSPVERLVLAAVAEHSNARHGWTMFWGQKRIAAQIGVSDRAVRSAYKTLEDRGFISRTSRHVRDGESSRRSTDTIKFNVQAVKDASYPQEHSSGGNDRYTELSSASREHVAELSSASAGTQFRSVAELSSALNKEVEQVSEQSSINLPASSYLDEPSGFDDDENKFERWEGPDPVNNPWNVDLGYDWSPETATA